MAKEGIDLNYYALLKPTHVHRSDSCPCGMGGYNHNSKALHFYFPQDLLLRASNNLLEHLALIITPWINIIYIKLTQGDCSLSMTDSSTYKGWTKKQTSKKFHTATQRMQQ